MIKQEIFVAFFCLVIDLSGYCCHAVNQDHVNEWFYRLFVLFLGRSINSLTVLSGQSLYRPLSMNHELSHQASMK